jgi:hypothetical protein
MLLTIKEADDENIGKQADRCGSKILKKQAIDWWLRFCP